MDNYGVAFGDIFKIISVGNTTIVNYPLSIIHSCVSTHNGNFVYYITAFIRKQAARAGRLVMFTKA